MQDGSRPRRLTLKVRLAPADTSPTRAEGRPGDKGHDMHASYRDFQATAIRCVEMVGSTFTAADDDWQPTMLVESRTKGLMILALVFEDKVSMAHQIAKLLTELKAERCALVLSAWSAAVGDDWDGSTTASELAGRFETLNVEILDAERHEAWTAPILRSGEPPTLGPWKVLTNQSTGLLIEPLQAAMR